MVFSGTTNDDMFDEYRVRYEDRLFVGREQEYLHSCGAYIGALGELANEDGVQSPREHSCCCLKVAVIVSRSPGV